MPPHNVDEIALQQEKLNGDEAAKGLNNEISTPTVREITKSKWPQIIACLSAAIFFFPNGIGLGYSAVLIPQLEADNSDLMVTKEDTSWIASLQTLAYPAGAVFTGLVLDKIGRINTLKLGTVPYVIGWGCIALAQTVPVMMLGRVLTSTAASMQYGPVFVYISEVISPNLRGTISCFAPSMVAMGLVTAYTLGAFFHWRTVAWLSLLCAVIPFTLLTVFAPQSPPWLVSKGRIEDAEKSLRRLLRKEKEEKKVERELVYLVDEHNRNKSIRKGSTVGKLLKGLKKPTGFKPFLILMGIYTYQQITGVYVVISYGVSLFQALGTTVDPYVCTIGIGVITLIFGLITCYLMKIVGCRQLLMINSIGMAVSMFIAGYVAKEVSLGHMKANVIPAVCLLLYVMFSACGFKTIPWTMPAEMFPLEIRGLAQELLFTFSNILLSAAVKVYPFLPDKLGGVYGVLWLFSGISFTAVLYVFIFLPETHGKTLEEIEKNFRRDTVYIRKV